jgi:hypothetical protein
VVSEAAPVGVAQEVGARVAVVLAAEVLEEAVVAAAAGAAAVAAGLAVVPEDEAGAAGQMAADGFSVSR